ncbi:putative thymidylate synthase [Aureococcus anophagefferens virus]|uniref:thymidylate synthase n=1 Tax=Aureococcus anophagefferens virus TaxID=1474867 RepID=A0A076FMI9_9VIRU|nr:putative thymidylate synthase [Aureococcus anophagefferens virus]AII17128.1 putative thymidylate synthase [Aureococcus anophagefferens virus]UOG94355.1 Thymidylate synthase [Aureococcus anophagefferens virus]
MSIIFSVNEIGLFGVKNNNELAYTCTEDMKRFVTISKSIGNVVMGRNTFESLGCKPLKDRKNIIITSKENYSDKHKDIIVIKSIEDAFDIVHEPLFIGGSQIITSIFNSNLKFKIHTIYKTIYNHTSFINNGIFLNIEFENYDNVSKYSSKSGVKSIAGKYDMNVTYETLKIKKNYSYEYNYINQMKEMITLWPRMTRNGLTHSKFGVKFTYDCSNGKIPMLTTKKVAWKICIKELLWFLSGKTDNKSLNDNNVHIWDGNSTREFLDSRGLNEYPEGTLGPVYGFQWRYWGDKYIDANTEYTNGFDQIKHCEELIKNDPHSRRIIFSAWNVSDIDKMALPPCHILCQFYVEADDTLNLQFYQRSGDMFLGIPFNMVSYSVLLHIMCKKTGKKPGLVHHIIGDAHVYHNHIDAVNEQYNNVINSQPTIEITDIKDWNEYSIDDFKINDYKCAEAIKAPMSA